MREGFKYLIGYVGIIAQQEGIDNLLEIVDYLVNNKKLIISDLSLSVKDPIGNIWFDQRKTEDR